MGYNRKNILFDRGIADVDSEQIIQNEISLGRWIVDGLSLRLSLGESYDFAKEMPNMKLGYSYKPTIYLPNGCDAFGLQGSNIIRIRKSLLYETGMRLSEIYTLFVEYHRVYSEVFDCSYVEQQHALTLCTCFFIGLSLNDPNMMRMLDTAKRERGKSSRLYAFWKGKYL